MNAEFPTTLPNQHFYIAHISEGQVIINSDPLEIISLCNHSCDFDSCILISIVRVISGLMLKYH